MIRIFLVAFLVMNAAVFNASWTGCDWSGASLAAAGREPDLDVPYVPTSEEVVSEMLSMAAVGKNDVVYDLGCGDGRIVIGAAKRGAKRCVGVDMDPERISESRENAARAEVTDRVEFLQQDLFTTDFSEATVLTMYLLPDVNIRLRSKIFSDLRPGTRVVSHDFDMGEWEPDKVSRVSFGDTVYYWVVPANVQGTWKWSAGTGNGGSRYAMEMRQEFQKISGTVSEGKSRTEISEAALCGDKIQFVVEQDRGGQRVPVTYRGTVNGNTIEGTVEPRGGGRIAWKASR